MENHRRRFTQKSRKNTAFSLHLLRLRRYTLHVLHDGLLWLPKGLWVVLCNITTLGAQWLTGGFTVMDSIRGNDEIICVKRLF